MSWAIPVETLIMFMTGKKLKIWNWQSNMKDRIKCGMKCLTIEISIKNLVHIYLILPILKEMVIPCGGRAQPHYIVKWCAFAIHLGVVHYGVKVFINSNFVSHVFMIFFFIFLFIKHLSLKNIPCNFGVYN